MLAGFIKTIIYCLFQDDENNHDHSPQVQLIEENEH